MVLEGFFNLKKSFFSFINTSFRSVNDIACYITNVFLMSFGSYVQQYIHNDSQCQHTQCYQLTNQEEEPNSRKLKKEIDVFKTKRYQQIPECFNRCFTYYFVRFFFQFLVYIMSQTLPVIYYTIFMIDLPYGFLQTSVSFLLLQLFSFHTLHLFKN